MPDDDQKLHYERVPLLRHKADASAQGVKVPLDIIDRLGAGDRVAGICVLAYVFGVSPLHGAVIDGKTLATLGDSDEETGRRVLQKFIAGIRAKGRHATT
jgi:hypothetical protein